VTTSTPTRVAQRSSRATGPTLTRRRRGRVRRRLAAGVIAALLVLVAPVPWRHLVADDPPAMAWRLDGNLTVDGDVVDPEGRWSWLTVGRPPVVAELIVDRLRADEVEVKDLRTGSSGSRPELNEPAAAAVGLLHAGHDELEFGLRVEVEGPQAPGLPRRAQLTHVDGIELVDRPAWETVVASRQGPVSFTLADGTTHEHDGPELPFESVRAIDLPPPGLQASIYAWLPDIRPVRWARQLTLGSSHGLMVAVTTYADRAEPDLASGRHVAGTGGVRADGSVTRVGGVRAKARAARKAGADVLLYPAQQADELSGFDARGMVLLPVGTVGDAIEALRHLDELLPAAPDPGQVPSERDTE
jgi:hypothetical protein